MALAVYDLVVQFYCRQSHYICHETVAINVIYY